MKYAYTITNLLDMLVKPKFASERVNQLLFSELVTVGTERNGYCHVTQCDGYRGWVDAGFLRPISKARLQAHRKSLNGVVARSSARILGADRRARPPYRLYYSTPVAIRSISRGIVQAHLPDNSVFLLKQRSVRPINGSGVETVSGSALIAEAKKFLGVPYLWGGISPAGFDCSGLVQSVCAQFGIRLPRDTCDQRKVGKRISRDEVRSGDLLFFERHVGFAIGRDRIIHASVAGGGVRMNSLKADMDDYRIDLDRDFQQARRVL